MFTDLCRETLDSNPNSHYNGEQVYTEPNEEIVKKSKLVHRLFERTRKKLYENSCDIALCLFTQNDRIFF